jgi:hypothetical protein
MDGFARAEESTGKKQKAHALRGLFVLRRNERIDACSTFAR